MVKKLPNFSYEKKLWKRGFGFVAGADEVGRGALAGPVVGTAVVFLRFANLQALNYSNIRINDSKKLSAKQREKASKWIKRHSLAWGIGEVSVAVINKLGIAKATKMAFRKAIAKCNNRLQSTGYSLRHKKAVVSSQKAVDFLLIDAFYLPYTKNLRRKNQLAIIKGDQKSTSIAAASIIAKVYRDKLMVELSRKYRRYGWNKNKGYGTKEHQEAIKKWGITRLHRKEFCRKISG